MGRRGESIFRRKDGRWEARYSLGKDAATGRTKYRSVYGNTYSEAKEKRLQVMQTTYTPKKDCGFISVVKAWLEEKELDIKEQTYRRYRQCLDAHILPYFGKVKCSDITQYMVEDFLKRKRLSGRLDGKGGLSQNTIRGMGIILQSVLAFARQRQLGVSEMIQIKKPKTERKSISILTAVNNAGNERITTNTDVGQPIWIDITSPAISVSYDNNAGDTAFANADTGAYFNADRTATIVVTERNFDPDKVTVALTNSNGAVPTLSEWRTEQGSGNGDNTRHIATLSYATDGDYSFDIACTDQAGLANAAVTYSGLAPQRFTIDKTAPVISVSYDNNGAQNGNYYRSARTATVTINEHNFEASRVSVILTATDHGKAVAAPIVSGWSDNGDTHIATIRYDADARYSFDIEYRDKAGNAAADYAADDFYVDQTAPHVEISGIVDASANNGKGNIGFILSATDTNFDVFTPVVTATLIENGRIVTKTLEVGEIGNIEDGRQLVVKNLPDDGIYSVGCTVIDKAGNAFEEVTLFRKDGKAYTVSRSGADSLITFSVNRNGSAYSVDEYTGALTEKYYVQRVTSDLSIIEINADKLTSYGITLNGKDLREGTDYNVTQEGGDGDWNKYTYHISAALFEEEGEYNLVVSSVDKAENDAFSDVKGVGIHFVVDRTAPLVAISGLDNDARYQTERQTVTLVPTDDGGALKSLLVLLVDDDGNTIRTLVELQGDALEKSLTENDGKITFELEEGLYQNVRIICDDYADCDGDENVLYDETFTNVSVSSSAFMIFWANKPLRWGVIGGIGAICIGAVLLMLLKKRKKAAVR